MSVIVYVYSYNCYNTSYSLAGKSGLLKASNYLHINVSDVISGPPHEPAYRPYHDHSDNSDKI